MLARGDAIGVFQFESSGMREALREVRPTEFADLIALVALYRPGPMAFIRTYARNKRDPSRVTFEDPRLETITGPTYGVAVYQEQLMAISRQLAGFSPSRADDLRKAVGKKDKVLMASLKDEFIGGCIESGTDKKVAQSLWGLCEAAGDYSFNKSHAACYALLAYRTAYLKANHPAEYMASLLSSVMDTKDRVPFYVAACRTWASPCSRRTSTSAAPTSRSRARREIRFGLTATKGVGENAVVGDHRGPRSRGPVRVALGLLPPGGPGPGQQARPGEPGAGGRARLHGRHAPRACSRRSPPRSSQATRRRSDLAAGQESLFGGRSGGSDAVAVELDPPVPTREMPKDELLAAEKEALGLYVSSHPLQDCRRQLARAVTCGIAALADRADGEPVTVGGMLGAIKSITTRQGRADDVRAPGRPRGLGRGGGRPAVHGGAPGTCWSTDAMVLINGRIDQKGEGETKLVAQRHPRLHARRRAPRRSGWS